MAPKKDDGLEEGESVLFGKLLTLKGIIKREKLMTWRPDGGEEAIVLDISGQKPLDPPYQDAKLLKMHVLDRPPVHDERLEQFIGKNVTIKGYASMGFMQMFCTVNDIADITVDGAAPEAPKVKKTKKPGPKR